MEARNNEHSKKISTLSDKLKACDASIRGIDKDIEVMTQEAKNVQKLVIDARDAQNSIFARACEDFEKKQSDLLRH
jgi:hypothetical protein